MFGQHPERGNGVASTTCRTARKRKRRRRREGERRTRTKGEERSANNLELETRAGNFSNADPSRAKETRTTFEIRRRRPSRDRNSRFRNRERFALESDFRLGRWTHRRVGQTPERMKTCFPVRIRKEDVARFASISKSSFVSLGNFRDANDRTDRSAGRTRIAEIGEKRKKAECDVAGGGSSRSGKKPAKDEAGQHRGRQKRKEGNAWKIRKEPRSVEETRGEEAERRGKRRAA